MKQQERIDLTGAFKPTPEACREAVLHAVSACQEEKKMKRPLLTAIAVALILVLLGGTALALANYYSVRDSVAKGNPSKEFADSIIPLENSQTSNGITVTLGDAVFDGGNLAFTVQLSAAEDAVPMLMIPMLQANRQAHLLQIDYSAEGVVDLTEGFLYPSTDARYPTRESFNVSAECMDQLTGSVQWQYTVYMLKPKWEIVQAPTEPMDWQAYQAAFLKAWQEQKIMVRYGSGIDDYADAILDSVFPEDATFEESYILHTMLASGAFEQADVLTFEFNTDAPELRKLQGEGTFHFDGYDVEVKEITTSFMRVNYELELRFAKPQLSEHEMDCFVDLFDQAGNELEWRSESVQLSEDHLSARLWGTAEYISDTPLTALTFKPSAIFNTDQEKAQDESLWFTVALQ